MAPGGEDARAAVSRIAAMVSSTVFDEASRMGPSAVMVMRRLSFFIKRKIAGLVGSILPS